VVCLGFYWLVSGLVALGPGSPGATALLDRAGFGRWAGAAGAGAASLDILLALLLFVRRSTRVAALAMLAVSAAYLAVASVRLGWLWADPLGPLVKVAPIMALCLVILATDDRR
jgi:hypothetical protein